jgi:hypothetical protein
VFEELKRAWLASYSKYRRKQRNALTLSRKQKERGNVVANEEKKKLN